MPEPSINLLGTRELADGSRELFDKIGEGAGERFQGIADQVAADVRGRVPVDSGALAAAYRAEIVEGVVTVGIPSKGEAPYAGWIEFGGTREGGRNSWAERDYIPEGRYLYPVAFSAEPVLVDAGTDEANDEIRRFHWKSPSG